MCSMVNTVTLILHWKHWNNVTINARQHSNVKITLDCYKEIYKTLKDVAHSQIVLESPFYGKICLKWPYKTSKFCSKDTCCLTLSPPSTTKVPYCKQLGSRWDGEKLAVSSGSTLFDTQTTISPILSNIEALWKVKQARSSADDNLCGRLRVNEE